MIYVDDSGWGSLLGGVMIGVYDSGSKKFQSRLIPIRYFQGKSFKNGKYRNKALDLFMEMLNASGSDTEYFYICRGTVLDYIYEMLIANYDYKKIGRIEIGDPLQKMLESKFASYLNKLGVPRKSDGAHCLSFDDQLKWVYSDAKRIKHVKTGWNSWQTKYSKNLK